MDELKEIRERLEAIMVADSRSDGNELYSYESALTDVSILAEEALTMLASLETRESKAQKDARELAVLIHNIVSVGASHDARKSWTMEEGINKAACKIESFAKSRVLDFVDSIINGSEPKPKTIPLSLLWDCLIEGSSQSLGYRNSDRDKQWLIDRANLSGFKVEE